MSTAENDHVRRVTGVLITDLDNTLYDFPRYFEAGLRASVSLLTQRLNISEDALYQELAAVFERRDGIEYPFAWAEIPALAIQGEERGKAIGLEAAWTFWEHGRAALQPYPTVASTLRHLALNGVVVIGWTDAPYREALRRLRHLGLDPYMQRLVAPAGAHRSLAPVNAGLSKMPGYVSSRPRFAERIPDAERKPSASVIARLLGEFREGNAPAVVVGDSVQRDLAPAGGTGAVRLLAEYGARKSGEHSLLMSVVPTILPEVQRSRVQIVSDDEVRRIQRFASVIEHFPVQQMMILE